MTVASPPRAKDVDPNVDPLQHFAPAEVHRYWSRLLAPYARADNRRALFQLLTTSAILVLNWLLMLRSLEGPYWVTLLLAVPAAFLFVRMFIFQHDCGHGSFFSSQKVNNVVGSLIGVLTLTPYHYWRKTHSIHHATSGDLDRRGFGDVDTLTVKEYQALSPMGRLRYRAYRNIFTLLVFGPIYQFGLKHRFPLDAPFSWKREWMSVIWTNLAIAGVVLLAWQTIGIQRFLAIQLPILLIGVTLGVWLFYVQHQFEDTYWREHPEWNFHRAGIEGSSFYDLGPVLHWLTGNIGYHHIHHLASRIPNYHLQRCYREVDALEGVTRLTIAGSLRSARLHLWDEERQKLVSFGALRAAQTPSD